ncbi:MAG: FAD-dependent monooxygenase [Chitinophagales bacterium]|nr:FAD-dependent monooxygenase [Chitinophagales bacterium]MDW8419231.1 FAD-dependent monooxygenase [Chitinophagales bacterium]
MDDIMWDVIVVGSGCSGAMAAQTLVERGLKTLMIDGGAKDTQYQQLIPAKNFLEIRETFREQYRIFLGDRFEGIPFGKISTGEHLTPPRRFMTKWVQEFLPVVSDTFFPLESLAYGGLGNGWGLGCCIFSKKELQACGLPVQAMQESYEVVAKRIGISGERDDAAPYTAAMVSSLQPGVEMDHNGRNLYANYQAKKHKLNRCGFFAGRPSLALITQPTPGRLPYQYRDLDFYCDNDKSAYRPWLTLDTLKLKNNFLYIGNQCALRFEETSSGVTLHALHLDTQQPQTYRARKLVLACGVLGTARMVLRSFDDYSTRLPLLSNPYSYLAAIQPALLGRDTDKRKIGFAQLSLFYDKYGDQSDVPMGSCYSYRAMMIFHLLKESPLGVKTAYRFLQFLMPSFTIIGLFHPEKSGGDKWIQLQKNTMRVTGDELHACYRLSDTEKHIIRDTEKKFSWALRQLNCYVLKKIDPGHGASIHYGGTLPFSDKNERYRLLPDGRLGDTKNVYVADGSGFRYLPGKGITFSLMANAHRVALGV